MRTLLEVRTEIAALTSSIVEKGENGSTVIVGSLKKGQVSRIKNRIAFLTLVEKYLEHAPDELYLGREIARIENRITALSNQFDGSEYKDPTAAFKQYEKDMNFPHLRQQLKTLRYIKK